MAPAALVPADLSTLAASPKICKASLSSFDNEFLNGLRDPKTQRITPASVRAAVDSSGLLPSDPRLSEIIALLESLPQGDAIPPSKLLSIASPNLTLLHRLATKELAISDFPTFCMHLKHIFEKVLPQTSGANADYIPILRDADPEKFAVAFTSVDGQFFQFGDSQVPFSIQSTSKPLTFALALEEQGLPSVLEWCGVEPSGRPFNDMTLLEDHRPFNPMVNAGALMTAAVLASGHPELAKADKPTGDEGVYGEDFCKSVLIPMWKRLSGDGIVGDIGFSEETFLSERRTADNNIGMSYCLKARKGLPEHVKIETMIDLYLRACSITANTASMSVVAATLANGGRNPITGDQVFSVDTVKKTLSVLSFCGFYDNAGEFFFHTGVPSKSGVSGVVFLVLPNVGGFAFFSPRLDSYGNSVRGSEFAKRLVRMFTFHSFDSLTSQATGCKLDPRFSCDFSRQRSLSRLRWAVQAGCEQAKSFDELLVNVCLRVALADGRVDKAEIRTLSQVYRSVMQADLDCRRIRECLSDLKGESKNEALKKLLEEVGERERGLCDVEKEVLLEATFRITTADGRVDKREECILQKLSEALKVPHLVMDLKINAWKKAHNEEDG
eukprot:GFKZ01008601.1.p1 GENE.GFKZ01008601.1~~GFKZ01008601.1.p1  ORF type:complete len:612 (-),score=79.42 GFKZ01008601.1:1018-2853(-)